MNDADRAYKAAEEAIERARAEGATMLDFDAAPFRALDRLPPSIATLTQLESLDLTNTQVTGLAPLQGLSALRDLYLDTTQVIDITPLQGLSALETLDIDDTQVTDLRPITRLADPGDGRFDGLRSETPRSPAPRPS